MQVVQNFPSGSHFWQFSYLQPNTQFPFISITYPGEQVSQIDVPEKHNSQLEIEQLDVSGAHTPSRLNSKSYLHLIHLV